MIHIGNEWYPGEAINVQDATDPQVRQEIDALAEGVSNATIIHQTVYDIVFEPRSLITVPVSKIVDDPSLIPPGVLGTGKSTTSRTVPLSFVESFSGAYEYVGPDPQNPNVILWCTVRPEHKPS